MDLVVHVMLTPSTQHVTLGHPTLGHLARALLEYSESTSDFPRVAPPLPPLQCAYIPNIYYPIFVSVIISHELQSRISAKRLQELLRAERSTTAPSVPMEILII